MTPPRNNADIPRWIAELDDEDYVFLFRFLMNSGSLKALAESYGVSHPTIRNRLDRLIEKVRILGDESENDPFRRRIRALVAEGKVDIDVGRLILREYKKNNHKENGK